MKVIPRFRWNWPHAQRLILIYVKGINLTPREKATLREAERGMVAMDKKLFGRLVESMKQHGEIARGERAPSREFHVDAAKVRAIRAATKLSQARFANLIRVEVGTLRNWEQGRREPTGPARALLRAIENNPRAVLKALAD